MIAYLNNPKLKIAFIKEIEWHQKQDNIIKGTYGKVEGENWKGCAVGCSLKSLNKINRTDKETSIHNRYESELGIPERLAYLEDKIFEGLPEKDAKKWPLQFSQAIRVGSDLSLVWDKFTLWLLNDKKNGVLQYANSLEIKNAIEGVINLFKKKIKGKKITISEWSAAAASSYYAASAAAYASSSYAAASSYYAASYYAASAAAASSSYAFSYYAASSSSSSSSSYYAAAAYHYKKQSKKLIELLKKSPINLN